MSMRSSAQSILSITLNADAVLTDFSLVYAVCSHYILIGKPTDIKMANTSNHSINIKQKYCRFYLLTIYPVDASLSRGDGGGVLLLQH